MSVFKTYKEAVIANGSVKGIFTDGNRFYTDGTDLKYCNIKPCNPADYLETLADFLAGGKWLVDGDYFVTAGNNVVSVGQNSVSASLVNKPGKTQDNHIYVVKAAAYEIETLEEKEAFDAIDTTPQQVESLAKAEWQPEVGEKVSTTYEVGEVKAIMMQAHSHVDYVVQFDDDWNIFTLDELSKPETPAEREQRERLEAGYDLYCASVNAIALPVMPYNVFITSTFQVASMLAIVDKTGYRNESKK